MAKGIENLGYIMTFMMSLLTIWVFFTALYNGINYGIYTTTIDINSVGEAWWEVPLVVAIAGLIIYKFYWHIRVEAWDEPKYD